MPLSRAGFLALEALPDLLDPRAHAADRAAAARRIDRVQTTSLSGLPLHRAVTELMRRTLEPAPGTRLVRFLTAAEAVPPSVLAHLLREAPGLEPLPRGPRRFVDTPLRRTRRSHSTRPVRVRQGRLGDCWLIAELAACESAAPGFLDHLVRPIPGTDLVEVSLALPRLDAPGLRRLPFQPVRRQAIIISTRVPLRHRAGDARLRPTTASLVEKAAAIAWGEGSYRHLQNDFAGVALLLVTGRWCPARPVPRSAEAVAGWFEDRRPVVLSTLKRPGGSFELPREDGQGTLAFMDAHVYVARRVLRCGEDGTSGDGHPLRVHVHNPVGGAESRTQRRTDLYLSADQMRRAFISANVGPRLDLPAASR